METQKIQSLMSTEIDTVGGGMTGDLVRGNPKPAGWICWVFGCTIPPVIDVGGGE